MGFKALFVFGALVVLGTAGAFAQSDETMNAMPDETMSTEPQIVPDMDLPADEPVLSEPDASWATIPPQWVWGEVTSVDAPAGTFGIKHLDYETYEELKKTITVGKETVFENVADLSEVRVGDKVTIDYRPLEGLKVADMIVVEKEEADAAPVDVVPAVVEPAVAEPLPELPAEVPPTETEALADAPAASAVEATPDNAEAPPSNALTGAGGHF